jgi:hypothetical protein
MKSKLLFEFATLHFYPGLPEQAEIGEIPEEDWEIMEAVSEEMAA